MTLPKTDHMGLSAAKKYSSAGIMPAECAFKAGNRGDADRLVALNAR
ncbi:hypothetical protein [Thiocystis violacea]|nr:hypothetical protein [Thiocystis violacea]